MKVIIVGEKQNKRGLDVITHICFNCSHLDVCVCSEGWFCSKDGHHINNATILTHGVNCEKFDECEG